MSGQIANLSDATFDAEALSSNIPVLVDFRAEWCAPGKMIAPVLMRSPSSAMAASKYATSTRTPIRRPCPGLVFAGFPPWLCSRMANPKRPVPGLHALGQLRIIWQCPSGALTRKTDNQKDR
jgi:hypothetical protein